MKAIWNGQTIAQSDETIIIEDNHYFPANSVDRSYLVDNTQTSVCPWKGTASYYDVLVYGKTNAGAAWYYPQPSEKAKQIKDYVAFWRGVEIVD